MSDYSKYKALTLRGMGILNQLRTGATLRNREMSLEVEAVWDTGATGSAIARELIPRLGIEPTGYVEVFTPTGSTLMRKYLIDIELPFGVTVTDVEITESDIGLQGIGVLIGMDIINRGSFSLSSYGGQTVFSFMIPPDPAVDYVKKLKLRNNISKGHMKGSGSKKQR